MKTTHNGWNKENIQHLLATNDRAVERALVQIYYRQTDDEKNVHMTKHSNGVGFTAFDAEFLTELAQKCIKYNGLTEKQLAVARKKMTKYWKQLLEIAETSPISYKQRRLDYATESNGA